MRKLTVVLALAVLLVTAATGLLLAEQVWPKTVPEPADTPGESFTFAVCGDNRPSTADGPQPAIYLRILDLINETDSQFVLNTGDIILGTPDMAVANRQLDEFIAATERLKVPTYVAYGNHELRNDATLQMLEERIGPRYFAFTHGNSRFYVLGTDLPGQGGLITGEQLDWLKADLTTAGKQVAHRFVSMHRPLFSPMNDTGRRNWGSPENLAAVHQLFVDNDVEAVFSGHDHYFAWRMVDGVTYITTGGAGAPPYQAPGALAIDHYMRVEVNGERVSIKMVPVEAPESEPEPTVAAQSGQVILARGSKGWKYTDSCPTTAPEDRGGKHWTDAGYDREGWTDAALPFGYKLGGDVAFATAAKPNDGDYYLAGTFTAPDSVRDKAVTLNVNSDNGAVITINGKLADDDPAASNPPGHNPRYWNRVVTVKPGIVVPGENHIAVRLANNKGSSDAYFDLEVTVP